MEESEIDGVSDFYVNEMQRFFYQKHASSMSKQMNRFAGDPL